jgi:hypothetical protein
LLADHHRSRLAQCEPTADTCKGARAAASGRRKQAGNNIGVRKEGGLGIGGQNPTFFTW